MISIFNIFIIYYKEIAIYPTTCINFVDTQNTKYCKACIMEPFGTNSNQNCSIIFYNEFG